MERTKVAKDKIEVGDTVMVAGGNGDSQDVGVVTARDGEAYVVTRATAPPAYTESFRVDRADVTLLRKADRPS
mgnify:CR=1 FL=1